MACGKTYVIKTEDDSHILDKVDELPFRKMRPEQSDICVRAETIAGSFDYYSCINLTPQVNVDVHIKGSFFYLFVYNKHIQQISIFEYEDIDNFKVI